MQPSAWGPSLWRSIHYIALGYPDAELANAPMVRAQYREFYTNLWMVIPCLKCSLNYKRHLQELPIDGYLDSSAKLFEWTVLLHNIVNIELSKPTMDLAIAKELYMGVPAGSALSPATSPVPVHLLSPVAGPSPSPFNARPLADVSFLPHNITIFVLACVIAILIIFMLTQKKYGAR